MPADFLTLDEFQEIVTGMGFVCTRVQDPPAFTFLSGGHKLAGFARESHNCLQLFCGFNDIKPTLEFVNRWNADHFFCRAFVGQDGTSKFCYELDLSGGCATETNVQEFVKLFRDAVAEYAAACLQNSPVTS